MEIKKVSTLLNQNTKSTMSSEQDYKEFAGTADEEKKIGNYAILQFRKQLLLENITKKRRACAADEWKEYANPTAEANLKGMEITALRMMAFDAWAKQKQKEEEDVNYIGYALDKEYEANVAKNAIIQARKERERVFKLKQYSEKTFAKPLTLPAFTAEELRDWLLANKAMEVYGPLTDKYGDLVLDKDGKQQLALKQDPYFKEIFWMLCLYFTNDKRFEDIICKKTKQPYSLRKSLFMFGKAGLGKTDMMKLFRQNPRQSFVLRPCSNAAIDYKNFGDYGLTNYYKTTKLETENLFGQKELGICFDDLGIEEIPVDHMGTKRNVMEFIMLKIYDRRAELLGKMHLTTNLREADIIETYTPRVMDRFYQMYNFITYSPKAPSRKDRAMGKV